MDVWEAEVEMVRCFSRFENLKDLTVDSTTLLGFSYVDNDEDLNPDEYDGDAETPLTALLPSSLERLVFLSKLTCFQVIPMIDYQRSLEMWFPHEDPEDGIIGGDEGILKDPLLQFARDCRAGHPNLERITLRFSYIRVKELEDAFGQGCEAKCALGEGIILNTYSEVGAAFKEIGVEFNIEWVEQTR